MSRKEIADELKITLHELDKWEIEHSITRLLTEDMYLVLRQQGLDDIQIARESYLTIDQMSDWLEEHSNPISSEGFK